MISQLSFGYFSLLGGLFLEEYSRIELSVVASNGRENGSIFLGEQGVLRRILSPSNLAYDAPTRDLLEVWRRDSEL